MKMKDLKEKTPEDLNKILTGVTSELAHLRLKVAHREHARVTEVREKRRLIARVRTLLKGARTIKSR